MVWACNRTGPPSRARNLPMQRLRATWEAIGSQPSTSSTCRSGKERVSREMLPPAVWTSTGTEMAKSLSVIRNRTGARRRQAALSDSQNSPSLVAPSPPET